MRKKSTRGCIEMKPIREYNINNQSKKKKTNRNKKSELRKGIKANIRCNGTYIIISACYTRLQYKCIQSLGLAAIADTLFSCIHFDVFFSFLFNVRFVFTRNRQNLLRVGGEEMRNQSVSHIRFGTYIMQRTTHSLVERFFSIFAIALIWTVFVVAFIFSIIIIHLPTVWADFMNAFILTLSNLMANAVD